MSIICDIDMTMINIFMNKLNVLPCMHIKYRFKWHTCILYYNICILAYYITTLIPVRKTENDRWLIDWLVFNAISAVFQPYNGGEYGIIMMTCSYIYYKHHQNFSCGCPKDYTTGRSLIPTHSLLTIDYCVGTARQINLKFQSADK